MAASFSPSESLHSRPAVVRALQGAAIALFIGLIFFYGDGAPYDFGFRVFFPLLTASIGGASGGLFYYLMEPYGRGKRKVPVLILCVVVFLIAFWITAVAGLAVTGDWD